MDLMNAQLVPIDKQQMGALAHEVLSPWCSNLV